MWKTPENAETRVGDKVPSFRLPPLTSVCFRGRLAAAVSLISELYQIWSFCKLGGWGGYSKTGSQKVSRTHPPSPIFSFSPTLVGISPLFRFPPGGGSQPGIQYPPTIFYSPNSGGADPLTRHTVRHTHFHLNMVTTKENKKHRNE